MSPRGIRWTMSPGETLTLGKGFANDLKDGESLTGQVPTVTVHTLNTSTGLFTDVTDSAGFTVANVQPNASPFTASGGEVVAIGAGVVFDLTASETAGEYYVRVECDGDDGSHVVTTPYVPLLVAGPQTPA